MTITQIKYFLVTANCLNFTKAAAQLYITQPALSRQIAAMEEELGCLLFVRSSRKVSLTPSAVVLKKEFQEIYDKYNMAVAKAQAAYQGLSGELNIGILEGTRVGDLFPGVLRYFVKRHPNVDIKMRNYSFKALIDKLQGGELDIIITLKFDIENLEGVSYRVIEKTRDHIVVPANHPLALKDKVTMEELKDETFIMVSTEDSSESPRLIIERFNQAGIMPKIKFAPSIQAEMLWVEAGVGVCMLDSRNQMYDNPAVKFLDIEQVSDPSLVLAWNSQISNNYVKIFTENFTYNS